MKIRQGFVSNSSSSSFVVIMKAEDHGKFIASLDEIQEAVMDSFQMSKDTFAGETCIVYKGMTGDALWEDPEAIIGEDLCNKLVEEVGDLDVDLNETFQRIDFPKDSVYVYLDW